MKKASKQSPKLPRFNLRKMQLYAREKIAEIQFEIEEREKSKKYWEQFLPGDSQ